MTTYADQLNEYLRAVPDDVPEHLRAACAGARRDGADAARAAASWVVDGNTSADHIRRVLDMLDAGDPAADDHLPLFPNLSGEMAGDLTPSTLAAEHLPEDMDADEPYGLQTVGDLLCEQWEDAAGEVFAPECERILRANLPEPNVETDGGRA